MKSNNQRQMMHKPTVIDLMQFDVTLVLTCFLEVHVTNKYMLTEIECNLDVINIQ